MPVLGIMVLLKDPSPLLTNSHNSSHPSLLTTTERKKDCMYLLNIQQGGKETLRQYVDRFRKATLEVLDL